MRAGAVASSGARPKGGVFPWSFLSLPWDHAYDVRGPRFRALGLADGADITTWPDEVGSNDLTSLDATTVATFDAGWKGRGAAQFTGVAARLGRLEWTEGTQSPWSIAVLAEMDSTASTSYLIDGSYSNRRTLMSNYPDPAVWRGYAGGNLLSTVAADTTTHLHCLTSRGNSTGRYWVDDVATDGDPSNHLSRGLIVGGAYNASAGALPGRISAVGVYFGDIEADLGSEFLQWQVSGGHWWKGQ